MLISCIEVLVSVLVETDRVTCHSKSLSGLLKIQLVKK